MQIFYKTSLSNLFPYVMAFQKAKNYQILTTKSGSKQRFSLIKEKVVIVLKLQGAPAPAKIGLRKDGT